VDFRLLGPLGVEADGRDLTPARPKQRMLLGFLLLRANEVVSTDDLIDALWGSSPPQTAPTALQGHVSALRKSLGAGLIETQTPGYRLRIDPTAVDIHRFEGLLTEARSEQDPARRGERLREALQLFRGEPLAELRYEPFATTEASRLDQLRLAALADRAEARLELGHHLELLGELEQLVAAHPHEERLRGILMLALYRAGRQTQALDVYADGRRRLVDELGIEPGPALQQLERQILNQDSVLVVARTEEHRPSGTVTFLFTDVEGSTRLLRELGADYAQALEGHRELLRTSFAAYAGHEVDTQGDAFFVAFDSAKNAVAAAVEGQRALTAHTWPQAQTLQVRIGIHTCEAQPTPDGYVGIGIHRAARICASGHGGQTLVSQTTRELLEEEPLDDVALRDLGAHRLKDLLQPDRIFQVIAPGLAEDFPPLDTLDLRPTNLPTQPTPLIGRERELEDLRRRLRRDDDRVVTLTGPGGAGKTRLALQAAADVLGYFPDGTFFVPLASIAEPEDVIPAVAQTLNVRESGGRTLQRALDDYLGTRTLLIVLDNVEHVIAAAPAMTRTLSAAPGVKVLATSRAPLHVTGERVYPVPSLTATDAVDLFVDRARSVRPDFELTQANAGAVTEICSRLDRLPLAIELAAARVVLFPPASLLARLDERLKLLTGGARDRPERHQTLHAAIDWSHELLSPTRRTLFAQLAVFSGGWTLEAAEAVCNDDLDVIDGLGSLIDKNLVRLEGTEAEPRFAMLETIRAYAQEQLEQTDRRDELCDRHLAWAVAFAEQADPELRGPDQSIWLERLQAELDNFRSAFAWAVEHGEAELALRLGSGLIEFWIVRADWSEGRNWLERALALPGHADPAVRMRALRAVGELADALSDYGAATDYFEQSLAVARSLGDRRGVAEAQIGLAFEAERVGKFAEMRPLLEDSAAILRELGDEPSLARSLGGLAWLENDYRRAQKLWDDTLVLHRRLANKEFVGWTLIEVGLCAQVVGDYAAARRAYDESLEIARELSYERMTARALTQLGEVALFGGRPVDARRFFDESLPIWREIGHRSGLVDALRGLGDVARVERDFAAAAELLDESLTVSREIGARPRVAMALHSLGVLAAAEGDFSRSESLFEEAAEHWRDMNDIAGTAETLRRLGELAVKQGRFQRAARLLGDADALREQVGAAIALCDRPGYERALEMARAELGDDEFDAIWTAGRDVAATGKVR
jgi:predicted ATPase/DNA-binding SARP family transcriptional activator